MTVSGQNLVKKGADSGRSEGLLSTAARGILDPTTKAAPRRANVRGHGTGDVPPMHAQRTAAGSRESSPLSGSFTVAHLTDESLRRLATQHRRDLEDIESGDLNRSKRSVRGMLVDVETEQAIRAALRDVWQAEPFGTESSADFEMGDDGVRIKRTDLGPSYGLALMFDWERHLRGESTALAYDLPGTRASS